METKKVILAETLAALIHDTVSGNLLIIYFSSHIFQKINMAPNVIEAVSVTWKPGVVKMPISTCERHGL